MPKKKDVPYRRPDTMVDLIRENEALREKFWSSKGKGKRASSSYFLLINSNYVPHSAADKEHKTGIFQHFVERKFARNFSKYITFNNNRVRKGHKYTRKYVNGISIKYVIETGRGRILKGGGVSRNHGKLHAHIAVDIDHNSNISWNYDEYAKLCKDELYQHTAKTPFVARPKLIHRDMVEEYMLKSAEFDDGAEWIESEVDIPSDNEEGEEIMSDDEEDLEMGFINM